MSAASPAPALPWHARAAMLLRLFAVQGAWNYETMLGNGIAFALEPALRRLPGGVGGSEFRSAMAREVRYFNAHPYLAAVAVGALARAELDHVPSEQIDRFRAALCGPLGSIGDRLIWAGWLPACAMLALLAFGWGAKPLLVVLLFLATHNAGHIAVRLWGLNAGWRQGLHVAGALAHPLLREGPQWFAAATLVMASVALPLTVRRVIAEGGGTVPSAAGTLTAVAILAALLWGVALVRLQGRIEGWKIAFAALVFAAVMAVIR